MFDEDRNSENMLVKEPQLEILYYSKPQTEKKKDTLNVLSLFYKQLFPDINLMHYL